MSIDSCYSFDFLYFVFLFSKQNVYPSRLPGRSDVSVCARCMELAGALPEVSANSNLHTPWGTSDERETSSIDSEYEKCALYDPPLESILSAGWDSNDEYVRHINYLQRDEHLFRLTGMFLNKCTLYAYT